MADLAGADAALAVEVELEAEGNAVSEESVPVSARSVRVLTSLRAVRGTDERLERATGSDGDARLAPSVGRSDVSSVTTAAGLAAGRKESNEAAGSSPVGLEPGSRVDRPGRS